MKQVDLALGCNFQSSSMPDSFYANLSQIFSVPFQRKQENTSGDMVPKSISFPPPPPSSSSLTRASSVISASSLSTSSEPEGRSVSDRWNDRYQDLRTGHCHVPINYKENPLLSRWTKRQRYQWKLKQEGKQSSMTDTRQTLLEELGFLWDVRHTTWESRYQELLQFHKIHGHCHVSINCKEHPKLVSSKHVEGQVLPAETYDRQSHRVIVLLLLITNQLFFSQIYEFNI